MKKEYFWWADLGVTALTAGQFGLLAKEAQDGLGFFGFGALFLLLVVNTGIFLLLLGGGLLACFRWAKKRWLLAASAVVRGLFLLGWFSLWKAIPSLWTWTETWSAAMGVTMTLELINGWKKPS